MSRLLSLCALLAGCTQSTSLSNGGTASEVVTGSGKMMVDPAEVYILDLEGEFGKSALLTISSIGDANLVIYEIKITADATDSFFFEEVEDVELQPGASVSYPVYGQLSDANPAEGQLRLRTNDVDATSLTVPLYAWPLGYEPPDTVTDTGTDTGTDSGATTP